MSRIKIIVILFLLIFFTGCKEKKQPDHFQYFRNYSRTFHDLNDKHIKAARKWGITPVTSTADIRKMQGQLEELRSCRWYEMDKLTHSSPYLVPRAHNLLKDIARNFRDSLDAKNLPAHNIIVTSVLRTNENVKKLKKKNLNASANSAHMFGTTFDLAYTRFKKVSYRGAAEEKLKSVLAEVLHDLQKKKRCYVRYEYKQGCFHITVRN